jgi:hypothetical protein
MRTDKELLELALRELKNYKPSTWPFRGLCGFFNTLEYYEFISIAENRRLTAIIYAYIKHDSWLIRKFCDKRCIIVGFHYGFFFEQGDIDSRISYLEYLIEKI